MSRLGLAGVVLLGLLLAPLAASAQMSPQERTRVSDQMQRDITRTGEIAELGLQQQRVGAVFHALLRQAQRRDVQYRVAVQRSREVNAYALPDGRIIVTTELLRRLPANDDSALAFVLAHELSHVEKRHAERQAQQDAAGRVLIGVLTGRGDNWVRILGGLSQELLSSGYSRGMESEADKNGLELMNKAGYDPNGSLTTLAMLASLEGSGLRVFPTHPKATDRYKSCVAWMNDRHIPVKEKGAAAGLVKPVAGTSTKPVAGSSTKPAPGKAEAGATGAGFGKRPSTPAPSRPDTRPDRTNPDGDDRWAPMQLAPDGLLAQGPPVRPSPSARPAAKPSPKPSSKPAVKPSSKPSTKPSAKPSPKPSASPSAEGGVRTLPPMVLRDRAGKKVPLSRYLGKKPIVLYLYSTPVDQTALDLQNLQAQMDNLGVQAIVIHGDRARRDRALQQFLTVAIAYPILLDGGEVARWFGVAADPTIVLVAPDGREVKRWSGFGSVDKLSGAIKESLQGLGPSPEPQK